MDNTKKHDAVLSDEGFQFKMELNDNKAGMEGLDKEKINKIIMEATKGSRFYENELKKDQQVNHRIEKMMQQKAQITSQQLKKAQIQVDKLVMELEESRDLSRVIVHIDMDAFYASVEMRDNLELRDKPMAVGSMSMLSTSNYLARRFGVRAAMPGFIAKKLCPNLVIVPLNFDKYRAVSKDVREILVEYDLNFLPLSLDEAYIDLTEHLKERLNWSKGKRTYFLRRDSTTENSKKEDHMKEVVESSLHVHSISPVLFEDNTLPADEENGSMHELNFAKQQVPSLAEHAIVFGTSAEETVKEIRFRIEQKTTLTASAGIAPNMMLAKVCSDKNKPNGQFRIPPNRQDVMDFIKDLPIRKVPGIGRVTEKMLKALGITTCTELYQQRALVTLLFSETSWHNFLNISLGLGSTHIEKDGERKSMSTERTFSEISVASEHYTLCQELCRDLAQDLLKEGLKGKTVTLKLKNVNFEVKTRAYTVLSAVSTEEEIFAVAKELLRAEIEIASPQPLRLRLMGVRVSSFLNEEEKKHHQKSILNFLQAGKVASTLSSLPPEKLEPRLCNILPLTSHGESFFNKKRAEMQQNREPLREDTLSQQKMPSLKTLETTGQETNGKRDAEKSTESQILTCPVCFRKQETSSLETFNKHIDKCLMGACGDPNMEIQYKKDELLMLKKSDINNASTPLDDKKKNLEILQINKVNKLVEDCEGHSSSSNAETVTSIAVECKQSKEKGSKGSDRPSATASNMCCLQNVSAKEVETQQPCTSGTLEDTVLICPVCNLEQKTTSLALFNRHVDVCLNKGIIQKLTEESTGPAGCDTAANTPSSGSLGRGQQDINTTTRTKRPGLMPQQPSSKKAKAISSRNTIDKFFK
ncbi:DNA polymerase kappa [Microcaecilia unicolor]|uniref:DNA polymerase kappa n=1 Tax=Microcaecilia unicolor TaxID=1415580 RepID=A0A6P7X0R0_9AMPH|nr:DNA polymerase kappa [Microcaecilia unicolor]XP_030049127.1 DNA polymerase kappa [Microcaecilia unicolor]XP_030049128.1 DNA polymerase kappa [Microcaecilia unicolor]